MTDCVALFWCHCTASCRDLHGVVLSGHVQKHAKQPSTSVGHISSITSTNEYSQAVAL